MVPQLISNSVLRLSFVCLNSVCVEAVVTNIKLRHHAALFNHIRFYIYIAVSASFLQEFKSNLLQNNEKRNPSPSTPTPEKSHAIFVTTLA